MQKIVTHLWFDTQAEEAAQFYVSLFKNSRINYITHYGPSGAKVAGQKEGSVMTVAFQLDGQDFFAINGGPVFKFNHAISLFVNCETQEEIDDLWKRFSAGGEIEECGWLRDKYGVSWQIVPRAMEQMVTDTDPDRVERVMEAMFKMKKLDLEKLRQAYEGGRENELM